MTFRVGYWADLRGAQFDEDSFSGWVHAAAPGTYQHSVYGELDFTPERLQRFADSVNKRVRGIDIDIDFDHKAKSGEAAGWVRSAQTRSDGLWLFVEWTKDAFTKIKDKAYRYFSPEFADEWTDPQGNKFKDVLFGGGITNRPFLKNLVPLNLSELTFTAPEPNDPSNGPAPKEDDVDLKKLREILGLAEDTPEEDVYKVFGERLQAQPPAPDPNNPPTPPAPTNQPPTPPAPTPEPRIQLSEELKQLADQNPVVKSLLDAFEAQTRRHAEDAQKLQEAEVGRRLSELDKSKLIITPAIKELIHGLAISLDEEQSKQFWDLMTHMHSSQSFLVELGERAGAGVKYGRDKSASTVFAEKTAEKVTAGMSYPDAVEQVAQEDPKLYDEYRNENFSFKA